MIAWIDKNGDGIMQYRAGNVFAGKPTYHNDTRSEGGPRPVTNEVVDSSANEVYYDKDIIVLANPEMAGLPKWVIALVMAGTVWPRPHPPLPVCSSFSPLRSLMT